MPHSDNTRKPQHPHNVIGKIVPVPTLPIQKPSVPIPIRNGQTITESEGYVLVWIKSDGMKVYRFDEKDATQAKEAYTAITKILSPRVNDGDVRLYHNGNMIAHKGT